MLNYIKSKISEMDDSIDNSNDYDVTREDDTILEYAHMFQELADLSIEGEDSKRDRSLVIDIPLEDDIEIDTIEFNLNDGRITDVPMDATVQECQYDKMKSYDEFINEAYAMTDKFMRESDYSYGQRIKVIADKKYKEYQDICIQEGMFGFGMININDARVPSTLFCDFGSIKGTDKHYCLNLDVFFQTDGKHRISKKQLDAVNAFSNSEATLYVMPKLLGDLKTKYPEKMEKITDVWDVAKPAGIYVRNQNGKEFEVSVCFNISFMEKDEDDYFMIWRHSTDTKKSSAKNITSSNNKIDIKGFKSKKNIIRESYEYENNIRKMPSRFDDNIIQEAIDFGNAPENDNDPPIGVDNNEPPAVGGEDQSRVSGVDDTGVEGDVPPIEDDNVPVDTNDVSDKIADKVNDIQSGENGIDNNIDIGDTSGENELDDTATTDDGDTNVDGDVDDNSVDGKLNELDDLATSDDDTESDLNSMDSTIDVENMTIDELIQQGSEKLKGMTIQQIKDFISQSSPEEIQEAFVLTKNNINKELSDTLKEVLTVLNDSEKDAKTLLAEFKKKGKYLNRILSKASKSTKVYSNEEIDEIKRLNKNLVDLTTLLNSVSKRDDQTLKYLIKSFVSQAVVINKICEDKNGKK